MAACREGRRSMRYHDGELPPEERRRFEGHLADCPECARELERLRAVSRLLEAVPAATIPYGALGRLHANLGNARERVIIRICRPVAIAATALLAVCALWLWQADSNGSLERAAPASWELAAVTLDTELTQTGSWDGLALWTAGDLAGEDSR